MAGSEELVAILKKLRLSGVLQSLELRVKEAVETALSHEEFLLRLLHDEVDRRDGKQLDLRLRRANFEHERTLEGFDFAFNPEIPRSRVIDLGSCAFVERREDVLFIGPTGTGKSHLAQALGHRACRRGMAVLFTSAQELFGVLRAARGDGSYDRKLARYVDVDLLIVDDLGLRPLRNDEPYDLHELVRQRHERRSTVMTTNPTDCEPNGEACRDRRSAYAWRGRAPAAGRLGPYAQHGTVPLRRSTMPIHPAPGLVPPRPPFAIRAI